MVEIEKFLRKHSHLDLLGLLLINRGNAHYHAENYAKAESDYRAADRLLRKYLPQNPARLGLLINLGNACLYQEQLDAARRFLLEAESLATSLKMAYLAAHAKHSRAVLETHFAEYGKALTLLEQSQAQFTDLGTQTMVAAVKRTRAEVFLSLGLHRDSVRLAREASESFQREEMTLDQMLADFLLAEALLLQNKPAEASQVLRPVKVYFGKKNQMRRYAATLLLMARTLRRQKKFSLSIKHGIEARSIFKDWKLFPWETRATLEIAEALGDQKNFARADHLLRPYLRSSRSLRLEDKRRLFRVAGTLANSLGETKLARRRLQKAVAMVEDERALTPAPAMRAAQFKEQNLVFLDFLDLEIKLGRTSKLLPLEESAREYATKNPTTPATVTSKLVKKLARLRAGTRNLDENSLEHEAGTPTAYTQKQRQLTNLEAEILSELRTKSNQPRKKPHTKLTTGNIEPRPHEAVVTYFVLGKQLLCHVIGVETVETVILESAEKVRSLVEEFAVQVETSLSHPKASSFLDAASKDVLYQLHCLLIAPLMPYLRDIKKLRLVPHEFLHQVPFECLFDGKTYLIDQFLITRIPYASYRNRGRPRGTQRRVVSVTRDPNLKFLLKEARAVHRKLGSDETDLLIDPTSNQLLEAMGRAGSIHIASHGHLRGDNPHFSRLETMDGGLFVADMTRVRLQAQLVVLSACNSGAMASEPAGSMSSVALAFLESGCESLLGSLWRIPDEASFHLMKAFYEAWTAKRPVNEALQLAVQTTRKNWSHPASWGGFVCFGP